MPVSRRRLSAADVNHDANVSHEGVQWKAQVDGGRTCLDVKLNGPSVRRRGGSALVLCVLALTQVVELRLGLCVADTKHLHLCYLLWFLSVPQNEAGSKTHLSFNAGVCWVTIPKTLLSFFLLALNWEHKTSPSVQFVHNMMNPIRN